MFDVNHLIKIFDLLTRFVNKFKILKIPEAQAFTAQLTFLAKLVEIKIPTNLSGSTGHGWIKFYAEAVQYLFRTLGTTSDMCKVLDDIGVDQ